VIEALYDNFDEINSHRFAAQAAAGREYDRIMNQQEATS
jgi:hypothetical protein